MLVRWWKRHYPEIHGTRPKARVSAARRDCHLLRRKALRGPESRKRRGFHRYHRRADQGRILAAFLRVHLARLQESRNLLQSSHQLSIETLRKASEVSQEL